MGEQVRRPWSEKRAEEEDGRDVLAAGMAQGPAHPPSAGAAVDAEGEAFPGREACSQRRQGSGS